MHVDEFIDDSLDSKSEELRYARFFFLLHRLPAIMKSDFDDWIKEYKLFCTYKEERYRVTGASRMGDVWLAKDFNRSVGYAKRVDLDDCTDWKNVK